MNLLKPAEIEMAYAKFGFMGFAGTGKTYTATKTAIGLYKFLQEKLNENRPIAFLDTETGSDFVLPALKKEGIKVVRAKTRSFKDLLSIVQEAEKECSILIIDSITHFWIEIIDSYEKKLRRSYLQFQDWKIIKSEWRRFTDLYVNSRLHIIMCGRAGFTYDHFENDQGKKELVKTGTKMKAENDMGFEPSFLIEMELISNEQKKKTIHRAYILKDRSDFLDGKWFDNPTFKDFKPYIDFLNIGGVHLGVDTERNSQELFNNEGKTNWSIEKKQKEIILEEITAELTKYFPGNTGKDKVSKIKILEHIFTTSSWEAVKEKKLEILNKNIQELMTLLTDEERVKSIIDPEEPMSEKGHWARIAILIGENNITEDKMREQLKEKYGKISRKKLTKKEAEEYIRSINKQ